MKSVTEKQATYQHTNTYSCLFQPNQETKNFWLACHGLGYLSKYFIRYFRLLEEEKNYIVCPQAPSKYYQGNDFKYVGASWLTKENTALETQNVIRYLEKVYQLEQPTTSQTKFFLGYSQGVSVLLRWMAQNKRQCHHLIIHSGSIPNELTTSDFVYLDDSTKVHLVYGNQDEYIHSEKLTQQLRLANDLFGNRLDIHKFEGNHQVSTEFIKKIASEN